MDHLCVRHQKRIKCQNDAAHEGWTHPQQARRQPDDPHEQHHVDEDHRQTRPDEHVHEARSTCHRVARGGDAGQSFGLDSDAEAGDPHGRNARVAALERTCEVAGLEALGKIPSTAHPVIFIWRDEKRDPDQPCAERQNEQDQEGAAREKRYLRPRWTPYALGEESHHVADASVQYGTIACVRPRAAGTKSGGT